MKPQLSDKNLDIITEFFLGNTATFDAMDDDWKNLMMAYATDNNSSTIREAVTLHYLKYKSYTEKHGADGYDPVTLRQKEVKPKYVEEGNKMSNSGNFNDMTLELLETKKDYDIVCSLFSGTKLIYIVEFPMSQIYEHLKQPIVNAKAGKRVVCHFGYTKYDSPTLIVHYLNKDAMKEHSCLSKNHMAMLESKYQ